MQPQNFHSIIQVIVTGMSKLQRVFLKEKDCIKSTKTFNSYLWKDKNSCASGTRIVCQWK